MNTEPSTWGAGVTIVSRTGRVSRLVRRDDYGWEAIPLGSTARSVIPDPVLRRDWRLLYDVVNGVEWEPPFQPRMLHGTVTQECAASADAVRTVLDAPEDNRDGRSPFFWLCIVTPDDDAWVLATFPCGDTYFDTESDHS